MPELKSTIKTRHIANNFKISLKANVFKANFW